MKRNQSILKTLKCAAPAACASLALAMVGCGGGDDPKEGGGDGGGDKPDGGGAAAPAAEMVEITPDWPKPMFVGTPLKANLPNLEKPGKPRKSFEVPKGTEKISTGKKVTSSDDLPIIGEVEFVTDGDLDGAEGSYVELGPGTQWVQIDLDKESAINAVILWHFHASARAYKDVVVQISNDEKFEDGVTTVYNSDDDNSVGQGVGKDPTYIETNHGRIIDVAGVKGRFVRLYSGGNSENDSNHYVEVEVYGVAGE